MKTDKPTKAQKGAQILKSLKTHFGNSETTRVVAELKIEADTAFWCELIGVANNLGWTIEEVIGELIERYSERIQMDLDAEEKGTEIQVWRAQKAAEQSRLN